MNIKPVNQKAWLLILPALLLAVVFDYGPMVGSSMR